MTKSELLLEKYKEATVEDDGIDYNAVAPGDTKEDLYKMLVAYWTANQVKSWSPYIVKDKVVVQFDDTSLEYITSTHEAEHLMKNFPN